jgi:gamma-glutamylcyclotransferase (GGCT)/AIG2-like uncharacterized protein YtfP
MSDRLFVYGTLRAHGRRGMHPLLADGARLLGSGRVRGRLFDLGAFPGLVPAQDPGSWVRGEAYVLLDPERTLARLDEYEGCGRSDPEPHAFARVERDVFLDSGERTAAWVYVYRGSPANGREIVSGDYRSEEP